MAFKDGSADQYIVWDLDSSGNYATGVGQYSGTDPAFEAFETSFQQDLNGDGVIGDPSPPAIVIEQDGATWLTEVGTNYYLYAAGTQTGPEIKYFGNPVTAGEFGAWTLIGGEQTAGGYEVAFKDGSADQYIVWDLDSSGNYATGVGQYSGTDPAFEALETSFQQDLNGDGVIGDPSPPAIVIEQDGATWLTEVGTNYYLYAAGTQTGPEIKYFGNPVTAGEFGAWTLIGGEQTAGGYEVAFKDGSADQYIVWDLDSSGNYATGVGQYSGTDPAFEALETSFYQDLNGDGVIGTPSTVIAVTGGVQLTVDPLTQAATIAAGATLELTGADSGSITFEGATGTLKLDQSSTFSGQVFDFTGTGSLATSDVFDLKDIVSTSATEFYSGNAASGTLKVSDGQGDTANISLVGNYLSATFSLSSDGHGGTLVIDPPAGPVTEGDGSGRIANTTQLGAVNGQNRAPALIVSNAVAAGLSVAQSYTLNLSAVHVAAAVMPLSAQPGIEFNAGDGEIDALASQESAATGTSATVDDDLRHLVYPSMPVITGFAPAPDFAYSTLDDSAVSGTAADREIAAPHDLIRAVDGNSLAIKVGNAAARDSASDRQVWLFDDVKGAFTVPEPVTIVIDPPQAPAPADRTPEILATATLIVATGPYWVGVLREFGRKAARAMQQGLKWTS